jgi:hypothetical protein
LKYNYRIMKKILLLLLSTAFFFYSKTTVAQDIIDTPITHYVFDKKAKTYAPFLINGRVLGMNLEDVIGATVTNKRTAEKAITADHGTYQINAAKGDTLVFSLAKYSLELQPVRSTADRLNIILIKRKADNLPAGHSKSDYNKAHREDEELIRILEKDARIEGRWKY